MTIQSNLPDWCANCSPTSSIVQSLRNMKERVEFLYQQYPPTRGNDKILLEYYKWHFGNTLYKEDGIKRAGRYVRHNNPELNGDVNTKATNMRQESEMRYAIGKRMV